MTTRPTYERKPRTDALRNRERILVAALEVFHRDGASASLDEIARTASVGPGTLYRHFPTRDTLIEAVYRSSVDQLATSARQLAETLPPVEALRAWMRLFIDHVGAKHLIAPALNSVTGGPERLYLGARSTMREAIEALTQRAIASGDFRPDVQSEDFLRALIGAAFQSYDPSWKESAHRVIDLLLAGAKPAAP